ncbi:MULTISPECIES: efflux transporter outer membrane subunit [unclassified Sphingomonas]|uniref:efflux transporter outer membrane subunit n=1 Tax=unclassified Sphingomonas TaxID=196159 RepID=UPI0006F8D122|nr:MULTISPECIES: efflux transporter outer membrane subunit [unclassified Sphingomonas]KQX20297.1 multidrug transporter [Sphingomonas sp. Root1294]KQY67547.1 multidrug transporter [Sphingomonas sp. Root50]KRB90924.1 multidrug transporter [Sphingomonas sp. Root720]
MRPSRPIPFRSTAALGLLLSLGACASVPDLGARAELRTSASIAAEQSFAASSRANWPVDAWWRSYGDPQLAQLIEEGLQDSPDAAAAAARFRRAQGLAQAAGAPLLPSIGVQAGAGLQKQSYNLGIPRQFVPKGWQDVGQASVDLSFDLDLWGRNRAALAAATSEAEAARIEQDQARLMLATTIASTYADLARLHAERDVLAAALDLRSTTQKLVSDRVRNGLDTRAELKQADAAVPSARADLAAADEAIALTRNQLAALVGAGPDRGLTIAKPALAMLQPPGLPMQVTTDLIGRRPDIAAARARAEAAASRIKVAHADFFPAIRLGALVGVQSLGLDNLTNSGSTYSNVTPSISLPIFRGGALSGQYRGARGSYDEAVALYNGTVLAAYREVADAVTSQRGTADRLAQSRQALSDSEEAYAVARKRYEGGLSTYLNVLSSEEKLLQARRAVADLDARTFALDVALVRALGGGFTAAPSTRPSAPAKENPNG